MPDQLTPAERVTLLKRLEDQESISRRRALRTMWIFVALATAVLALVVFGAWRELARARDALAEAERQRAAVAAELEQKTNALKQASEILKISEQDITRLHTFGFLSSTEPVGNLQALVEESNRADGTLRKIVSNSFDLERRSRITLRYFRKGTDERRVEPVLAALAMARGFLTETRSVVGEPDTPTNAVWVITRRATADDVKLVAFNLIRVGVKLRYIGPYPFPHQISPNERDQIWIGADRTLENRPSLTVEQIAAMSTFPTN